MTLGSYGHAHTKTGYIMSMHGGTHRWRGWRLRITVSALAVTALTAGPALANPGSYNCPFGQGEVTSESSGNTYHFSPAGGDHIGFYPNGNQVLFRATLTGRSSSTWEVTSTQFVHEAGARCVPI